MDKGKKKTNADRLREMTDDELVDELYRIQGNAVACPDCYWKSGKERLDLWLKMEVSE